MAEAGASALPEASTNSLTPASLGDTGGVGETEAGCRGGATNSLDGVPRSSVGGSFAPPPRVSPEFFCSPQGRASEEARKFRRASGLGTTAE